MTKSILTIAGACLLLGIAAGATVTTLLQESENTAPSLNNMADGDMTQAEMTEARPQTSATTSSPFAVIDTEPEPFLVPEPIASAPTNSLPTDNAKHNASLEINYSELADYKNLLATLKQIEAADETLLLQWIEQVPASHGGLSVSSSVSRALFQKLTQLQPSSTVSWIEERAERLGAIHPNDLLRDAIAGYAIAQPAEAVAWLATLDPATQQSALMYSLTLALGGMNPEQMLAQIASNDDYGMSYEIVNNWASIDPAAALDWLENRATSEDRDMYESAILESLMQQDPDAALAYLENSPGSEQHDWLLARYASVMAQSDPRAALDWALEKNDPRFLETALMELIWSWPENDLDTLQAQIETIEDPVVRESVQADIASRFLSQLAQDDPGSAMAWIDTQSESIQQQLRPQAVAMWLEIDPASAVNWLQVQPDSAERREALMMSMWQLPAIDIDLALVTFQSMNSGDKIGYINPMINALQRQRPSMVQQWVAELDDPSARDIADIALRDQQRLANPEQFIAELDQATGEERLDKIAVLFRSFSEEGSMLLEQWLMNNPLTEAEERALAERQAEFFPGQDDYC